LKNDFVIKFGRRGKKLRYLCKSCNITFLLDFSHKKYSPKSLTSLHLDGLPFRKLSKQFDISPSKVMRLVNRYMKDLPPVIDVTSAFSDMSKFSGFLVFDGKFLNIKDYESKIPLIWSIDFFSHDIPHSLLVPSENYVACKRFFSDLSSINYPLIYLVCDDNRSIKRAAKHIFPNVIIQACWKHYLESIRNNLNTKSSDKYLNFMSDIEYIFYDRLTHWEISQYVLTIYSKYKNDNKTLFWMDNIMFRRFDLTNYHQFKNAPRTTNLIESLNSHLNGRLKTIKSFQSFHNAKYFLNAYVLNRRLSKYTDCGPNFKHCNGKKPIQFTLKKNMKLPTFI